MAVAALTALTLAAACSAPFETSKVRILQIVDARKAARGAWITVRDTRQDPLPKLAGELLAASADSIYLLAEGRVTALPTDDLEKVILSLYEAPSRAVGKPMLVLDRARGERWPALVPHARFPQGLPEDFDRGQGTTQ